MTLCWFVKGPCHKIENNCVWTKNSLFAFKNNMLHTGRQIVTMSMLTEDTFVFNMFVFRKETWLNSDKVKNVEKPSKHCGFRPGDDEIGLIFVTSSGKPGLKRSKHCFPISAFSHFYISYIVFKFCRTGEKCFLQMLIHVFDKMSRLWSSVGQNRWWLVRGYSLCPSISQIFPVEFTFLQKPVIIWRCDVCIVIHRYRTLLSESKADIGDVSHIYKCTVDILLIERSILTWDNIFNKMKCKEQKQS